MTFDKTAIETLARQLFAQHGLADWTFRWDTAKTRLGCCYYGPKQITLSLPNAQLNSHEVALDTLKHEIAHALTPKDGGHGKAWKLKAMELGCSPVRCADASVNTVKGNYRAQCPACGNEYHRHRPTVKTYYCPCNRARSRATLAASRLVFHHKDAIANPDLIPHRVIWLPEEKGSGLPTTIQRVRLANSPYLPADQMDERAYHCWLERELNQPDSPLFVEVTRLIEIIKQQILVLIHPDENIAQLFKSYLLYLATGDVKRFPSPPTSLHETEPSLPAIDFSVTPVLGVQGSLFDL